MNREQLISRKHEVIADIARTRRELEKEQQRATWRNHHRRMALERRLDALMAEEHRLRLEIDRTRL